jgi:carboxypeptidase Taq
LKGVQGILEWDMQTYMPAGSDVARGAQLGVLSTHIHRMETQDEIGSLLKALPVEVLSTYFTPIEQGVVREAKRNYEREVKLPEHLVQRAAELSSKGYSIWVKAKAQNDWNSFAPVLDEWVELRTEMAKHYDAEKKPYDVWIDHFERSMSADRIRPIFDAIKPVLVRWIATIASKTAPQADAGEGKDALRGDFPVDKQQTLSKEISAALGFDFNHGRLDLSPHPFTGGAHPTDVRITTRFRADEFVQGLAGTVHETGHALYEQGRPHELADLPISAALSMGVHESQSLFYERMVGQSEHFATWAWPHITTHFPDIATRGSASFFYAAMNRVAPSLIRVEADEVTYPLHIILRFEIESALFAGTLRAADVPRVWREKMREYLGVEPATDTLGALQDVHWCEGLFGYFPSYTLGAMLAAQLYAAAERAMPTLNSDIAAGRFSPIREWLRINIHQHGSMYMTDELVTKATGETLQPRFFLEHLSRKYSALYGVALPLS